MVPTSALGLLLFVVLLAPGLAYVLRSERSVPAPDLSAFRESLRVLFSSIVCLVITTAVAAVVSWRVPKIRPDAPAFLLNPSGYAAAHFTLVSWWMVTILAFATLIGYVAADPRLLDRQAKARRHSKIVVAIFGKSSISEVSAWHKVIALYAPPQSETGEEPDVRVGALMDDGSYVRGWLLSYSTVSLEDGNRDLVIAGTEIDTPDGNTRIVGESAFSIISARNIKRLDITHVVADSAEATVDVPGQRVDTTTESPT